MFGRKVAVLSVSAMMILLLLAGCGQGTGTEGAGAANGAQGAQGAAPKGEGSASKDSKYDAITKPVTVSVLWSGRKDQYDDRVGSSIVKAKMPNVTFEYHQLSEGLENLIAAGVKLDVLNITGKVFYDAKQLALVDDMNPLLKKHNFDMSRFVPEHVEIIKKLTNDGKLDGLPDKAHFPYVNHALVYNKDIFDKFAVPYPKDHMTWDEVIELSKRVNREDGGQQYTGLLIQSPQFMVEQLALNYTDKNNKANLSNPLFKEIFRVYNDAYKAIGKDPIGAIAGFQKDKNVAMFAGNVRAMIEDATRDKDNQPNWNIVTFPSFKGYADFVPPIVGIYAVSSISQHKDEALQLIDLLLGDELSKDIVDQYMNPVFSSQMNVNAVKAVKQSLYTTGEYDSDGNGLLTKSIRDVNKGNGDANTAIRQLQEDLQKKIDEEQK
jgi:multiple sugar transport system substrate-binding protein